MHEITEAVTSAIGDYGLYAVFLLMFVDAVLPAASELVMVYAGAVAIGAFPDHTVTLFGEPIESTGWAYVAMATAGTIGYVLGSILGWAIGLYGGRPYLERHGRWLHVTPEKLDRAEAWFERYGDATVFFGRITPVVRSFVSIPAGVVEMPLGRYTALTIPGSVRLVLRARGRRACPRERLGTLPRQIPVRRLRNRRHRRRRDRVRAPARPPAAAAPPGPRALLLKSAV